MERSTFGLSRSDEIHSAVEISSARPERAVSTHPSSRSHESSVLTMTAQLRAPSPTRLPPALPSSSNPRVRRRCPRRPPHQRKASNGKGGTRTEPQHRPGARSRRSILDGLFGGHCVTLRDSSDRLKEWLVPQLRFPDPPRLAAPSRRCLPYLVGCSLGPVQRPRIGQPNRVICSGLDSCNAFARYP